VNYPWLYSYLAPNHNLVINSTGPLVNDKIIPFQLVLGAATGMMLQPSTDVQMKLRAKNQNTYPGSTLVLFVDSGTTPVTVTNLQQAYNLSYTFAANTTYSNRFYIVITTPAKAEVKSCAEFNTIKITNPSTHWVNYSISSMATSTVIGDSINFTGTAEYAGLSAGDYQINFTNEIGMVSTQTVHIDSLPFSASISNNDTILDVANANLQFNSLIAPANASATYLWNFGDSTTSTTAAPNHLYSQVGIYQITFKATSGLGCIAYDTMSVHVSDFTGLQSIKKTENSFQVIDKSLQFVGSELPLSYTLYSMDGKLIQKVLSPQRNNYVPMNTPGIYIVKADYKSTQLTKKIFLK
jgi:PKD repeat protein